MYPPPYYKNDDPEFIKRIIRDNSFAAMTSVFKEDLLSTHLPFVFKSAEGKHGTVYGHVAAANPHVAALKSRALSTIIFNGAHAYISADWYDAPERSVPTWNYESVKVKGRPEILDKSQWMSEMTILTETYEPDNAWQISKAEAYTQKLMSAIVYFKMTLDSVEAICKMSNNKKPSEVETIIKQLRLQGEHEAANAMDAILKRKEGL